MTTICDSVSLESERDIVGNLFQGQVTIEGQMSYQTCLQITCYIKHISHTESGHDDRKVPKSSPLLNEMMLWL